MSVSRKSGFTLIEVIVVVAIVAIMAGIMIPMVYRVWESNDEELTRERMRALKVALVGDSRLVQNGVRTHFGYAGDIGQLPSSLDNLVVNGDGAANWSGPYLPAGFDPSAYGQDAWGRAIEYATATDAAGRRAAATLRSAGPDGVSGTGDDLNDPDLQVYAEEVIPTAAMSGNVAIAFQTPPTAPKNFYVGVSARYRNGTGTLAALVCCDTTQKTIAGSAGNTQVNYAQGFACAPPLSLPVGIVFVSPRLYADAACGVDLGGAPIEIASTISGNSLFVNLQMQSVSP